jgi:hypothetical protein
MNYRHEPAFNSSLFFVVWKLPQKKKNPNSTNKTPRPTQTSKYPNWFKKRKPQFNKEEHEILALGFQNLRHDVRFPESTPWYEIPLRTKPTHHEKNPGNPHRRNTKERQRLDNTNKLDELHFSLETTGQLIHFSLWICFTWWEDGDEREMESDRKTNGREDKRMKMMLLESGD